MTLTSIYDSNDRTNHKNDDKTNDDRPTKASDYGKGYESMDSNDDNQESDEAEVSIITRPSTAGAIGIDDNTQGNYTNNSSSAINNTDQAACRNVQEHTTGHGQSTAGSQGFSRSHSKHLIGYDRNWETEFPWLEVVTDDGKAVGMLCKLCRKHNTENKYNHF